MSEFLSNDILPDLWEEILKRHWTFLEMEESVKKLEERKLLEGCLKEFLCVVPHDRKFFLPETGHVLRKTVNEMDEFSVHKAIIGFEAISQYANNLFTKPWRKEYRVIKMYCGYFQHEIKSNLLDAVKLFKAMGYRQVSNELLMLDGPICPDQVTNVSRDAMAAYVECQIIKNIYSGVTGMGFNCTWRDIFHYRESHTGGSSQAIKGFLYTLQDRHFRKDQQENIYATIQRIPKATTASVGQHSMVTQCQNCPACCSHIMHHTHLPLPPSHPQAHLYNGTCAVRGSTTNNNISCALHPNNNTNNNNNYNNNNDFSDAQAIPSWFGNHSNKLLASYPLTNYHHQPQQGASTQHFLPHSRSLECYSEPPPPILPPHRHSFDQQHACTALLHSVYCQQHPGQPVYESPYDCLDGLSLGDSSSAGPSYAVVGAPGATNCNYNAAYSHPYNVSGNRYPLPYTISNQLNSHYDTPAISCNGGPINQPPYVEDNLLYTDNDVNKRNCNYHAITALQKQSSPLLPNRHYFSAASKDLQAYRQRSFPPDQHLIDFDDCAPLAEHDFHAQLHTRSQNNSFDYEREHERCERMYEAKQRAVDRRTSRTAVAAPSALIAGVNRLAVNSYTQTKDTIEQNQSAAETSQSTTTSSGDGNYYGLSRANNVASSVLPSGNLGAQQRCGQRYAREDSGASKTTDIYTKKSEKMNEFTESNYMKNKELNDLQKNGSRVEMVESSSTDHEIYDGNYYPTTLDDFVPMATSELAVRKTQLSPTQAIKNQDGVGSFESWNRVFKCSGYAKENDRSDSLVESLHLDSFNAPTSSSNVASNGISDKRRSSHVALALESGCGGSSDGGRAGRPENSESSTIHKSDKTLFSAELLTGEKRLNSGKVTAKSEKSTLKQRDSNSASSNQQKIKSALKSTTKAASNTSNSSNVNNNNNNSSNVPIIHQQKSQYKNGRIFTNTNTKRQTNVNVKQPRPVATQVVITSPDEWSCRICTFLNPNTKRICEMCSRSKDFNLDSGISNAPTCV